MREEGEVVLIKDYEARVFKNHNDVHTPSKMLG